MTQGQVDRRKAGEMGGGLIKVDLKSGDRAGAKKSGSVMEFYILI